ncbi:MAG: hypothetical protein KAU44_02330, partial [Candidatus Marinimicrobia bacterium]|nr:hypothetical protein [Candidatus Neomarinimicrobiota bacterium]
LNKISTGPEASGFRMTKYYLPFTSYGLRFGPFFERYKLFNPSTLFGVVFFYDTKIPALHAGLFMFNPSIRRGSG